MSFLERGDLPGTRLSAEHHVGDAPGQRVGDQEYQERGHQQTHH